MAHPEATEAAEMATREEEVGGAAWVDGGSGVPAVLERGEGVDEVGGNATKPEVAAPR